MIPGEIEYFFGELRYPIYTQTQLPQKFLKKNTPFFKNFRVSWAGLDNYGTLGCSKIGGRPPPSPRFQISEIGTSDTGDIVDRDPEGVRDVCESFASTPDPIRDVSGVRGT